MGDKSKRPFKIGAIIRLTEKSGAIHDPGRPILLIVKRVTNGKPDSMYWAWECVSGAGRVILQNFEEWMYEAVE